MAALLEFIARRRVIRMHLVGLVLVLMAGCSWSLGQTTSGQNPSQPAPESQSQQDIPDAPSTVQPPAPKPSIPVPNPTNPTNQPAEGSSSSGNPSQPPPRMPPVETLPPGSPVGNNNVRGGAPRNQINAADDLYKMTVVTNFVQIPVMVKYHDGRRVDGLLPKDFTVLENGKPQSLTYFSSDPFLLSVAVVLDLGLSDVDLQKINQTYSSLVGAFSPYDEVALYTYSSTVSQVMDFNSKPARLTATLDQMKLVRGHDSGPPVLGGPLASGPTVNGAPVGGPTIAPVNTPPKESYVLNDAILRAALDLSKRDRARRKVIFVISDGRERGSQASFREVLRVLQTHGIQVKAVVVGSSALPVYKQVEKLHHLLWQGYDDILPKYTNATGGGGILTEISRNSIEDAYAEVTSEARNQYTLGYSPKATGGSSAYRSIEIRVDKRGLDIYTKAGYYPVPSVH